jgi:hypothetical protein
VVTGSFPGCFYVEEADRFAGIKVEYPLGCTSGTRVLVSGTVEVGLEPLMRASVVRTDGTEDVSNALGIPASRLGNPSIGGFSGLSNVGLLVRTWGRVVSKPGVDRPYMVLTDGMRDVRVYCAADVEVDDMVVVTGICSAESSPLGNVVTLLTRDSADLHKFGL